MSKYRRSLQTAGIATAEEHMSLRWARQGFSHTLSSLLGMGVGGHREISQSVTGVDC